MDKQLVFALFGSNSKNIQGDRLDTLIKTLLKRGAEVRIEQPYYAAFTKNLAKDYTDKIASFETLNFTPDFVISIGGDGTFLKAASVVGSRQTPIIGVNMGRLGFLADILPDNVRLMVENIYNGKYKIEERAVIQLETNDASLNIHPYALNDIAILKSDMAAMISICVTINDELLTSYLADGLVISTPTGSTAYSLSIGGPIMMPQANTLSITAVAPHSLNIRPIVVTNDCEIKIQVESRSHNFLTAIDGRSATLKEGVTLTVKKAPYVVKMVKPLQKNFFDTLREKMMWGADNRELCQGKVKRDD